MGFLQSEKHQRKSPQNIQHIPTEEKYQRAHKCIQDGRILKCFNYSKKI